ncbi:MAG: hypothetical protein ACI97N_002572 [Cognaticolwellia sp.]|jgi:hypothetical protein
MKNSSFLILSIFFLISCGSNSDKPHEKKSTVVQEIVADTVDLNTIEASKTETFTIKATFINFHLGDAEHYLFEDELGKSWDFAGSECDNFDFTHELNEKEADESNQGWGSNKDLQGKWFELTYIKREQPQYIDGPIVTVEIISGAVLVEK